jgi:hypothetical protein
MHSKIPLVHFKVNGKIIFNELLARHEEYISKKPIEFSCYDEGNAKLNWLNEPKESLDDLMLQYLLALRSTHEKFILSWSGGTDSQTIYNICVRYNIHIDEINVFYDDFDLDWFPYEPVEWIMKNHPDPTTVIIPRPRVDIDKKKLLIQNEDWAWKNVGTINNFTIAPMDISIEQEYQEKYGHTSWCLILGLEQPDVYFHEGQWYSRHDCITYRGFCGFENLIHFFTDPLLALKQSHLAKKAFKTLDPSLWPSKNQNAKGVIYKNAENYEWWACSIGRHHELHRGASVLQKKIQTRFEVANINQNTIDSSDLNLSTIDRGLKAMLDKDDAVAKLFVKGLQNVLLEKNFCEHLIEDSGGSMKNSLLSKSAGRRIYSKSYCIGT